MNDAQLIKKFCGEGDISAFNRLMERWQEPIHRVAYRYFVCHDEASEITQKTFIKVYKKLETLDDHSKFSSWIYRISHNLCRDEAKRAGRKRAAPMQALKRHPVADSKAARVVQQEELGSILEQALQQLPPEQRIVVIMKQYEELKFKEIAEILQENENTVKSRMYYGLRSLKKIFNHWNIKPEELL